MAKEQDVNTRLTVQKSLRISRQGHRAAHHGQSPSVYGALSDYTESRCLCEAGCASRSKDAGTKMSVRENKPGFILLTGFNTLDNSDLFLGEYCAVQCSEHC